ncbi:MAG: polysaccharide biosynthesis protein [Bacteroidia bacterium]|nr:polysaccharide biosynthesis protein [Bacteroidia bacterium]
MLELIKQKLFFSNKRPRWIIFLADLLICFCSLILAYLLRFNFKEIPRTEIDAFSVVFPLVLGVRALSFLLFRTYQGIVRYTGSRDASRIFLVLTGGSAVIAAVNAGTYLVQGSYHVPASILIIEYMGSTFLMLSTRFIFKALYTEFANPGKEKRNVIIFGAGESGLITKRTLDRDRGTRYKVLAFIDDDPAKKGKYLEGTPIHSPAKLKELLNANEIAHLIISIQHLPAQRKQEIVDTCLESNTKVLSVPPVSSWINGELSFRQIRKVNIEELLERDPIRLDEENIRRQNKEKVVLVTGAAGSIGSELVRQLLRFGAKKIILLDQSESPLFEVEQELLEKYSKDRLEVVVGDVRNKERMTNVFRSFRPSLVYHAAAYKHVPLMETNPSESVLTNIMGSVNVAELAAEYESEVFVLVSTDKAVNPTNVMGASKRIAEMYVQAKQKGCKTRFITTRFGNVIGSNGSVIPRFRAQIEKGGPVTITHPDITRYFMTIPEASQLVLEAASMGKGGEIFVFDMGKSVKIADLARKMIRLSGLELDKDIRIVYTGLRPGEKLFEELLADKEATLPTHHPQILIGKVRELDFQTVAQNVRELVGLFGTQDNKSIVLKMKELVPEFLSNNSEFEQLDK